MIGAVAGLLAAIEQAMPELCAEFAGLRRALGTLATLRVSGVRWNDLGEPNRVIASLDLAGLKPRWAAGLMAQPA
jgi:hypothetical protein